MDHNLLTVLNANSFGNRDKLTQICVNFNNISAIDPAIVQNSSLLKLRMEKNACYDEIIESRDRMEEKLKTCFDNFNFEYAAHDPSNLENSPIFDDDEILKVLSPIEPEIEYENVTAVDFDTNIDTESTTEPLSSTTTTTKRVITKKPVNCGRADSSVVELNDDNEFARGTYPWSAVIMKLDQLNSPCGGVLISENKVVTAGKCLYKYDMKTEKFKEYDILNLLVKLGSHHVHNKLEGEMKVVPLSSIHIHHDYNIMSEKMDADIAVIELKKNVKFSKFIQPICMMDVNTELDDIAEGVVVSYGHPENVIRTPDLKPKKKIIKIYQNSDCERKNVAFESISSNRTFCGGDSKGSAVCMEDIGSGLFIKHDDYYYLRGIVSIVVGDNDEVCDDTTYSLFTDVSKYIKWIADVRDDSDLTFNMA
ncbi:serine protease gd-like isoform X2 [Chironomus tepperi]|uniref:serine protease gd-like isoform X2 n=1 Tax=Chironomus tepperi TaxID=113505 RepID=UPI00391F9730